MENEFEFIKGYENLYKINRQGDIYSCIYKRNMVHQITGDNYLYVMLTKEGTRCKARIHRILALQYLINPDNLPEIDHIDRNRQNNSLDNLRWVTRIENRKNRADIIENLTEDQMKERDCKIRQYKKEWAEKDRRDKGCKLKSEMKITKDPMYQSNYGKKKRDNLTEEQKEERRIYQREYKRNNPLSEEQKEQARERARRQSCLNIINN